MTCVVSVVQDFEINSNTLAGQAVDGDEWKRQDIEHELFPSPDFYPPSFDLMNSAADYMAGKGSTVQLICLSMSHVSSYTNIYVITLSEYCTFRLNLLLFACNIRYL